MEDAEEALDKVVVLKMLEFLVVVLELINFRLEMETSLELCGSGYVDVVDIERLPCKVLERLLEELELIMLETETGVGVCDSGRVDVVDIERLPRKVLERLLERVLE